MEKPLPFAEKNQLQRLSTIDQVLCNTYTYHSNPPPSIIIPWHQHPHGIVCILRPSISSATAARARACCGRGAHGAAVAHEIAHLLGTYPDVAQTMLRMPEPGCVVSLVFWLSYVTLSALETVMVQGQADGELVAAGTVVSVWVRWCWTCSELRCGC